MRCYPKAAHPEAMKPEVVHPEVMRPEVAHPEVMNLGLFPVDLLSLHGVAHMHSSDS